MRAPRWLFPALLAIAWALDAYQGTGEIRVQGAFISLVISGVVAAIAWIADKAVTVAITIAQAAAMIGVAIAQFAKLIAGVFVDTYGFLGKFWRNILRPFATWTWQQIDELAGWLRRTFAPVIEFIEDVRRWVDRYYNAYVRPILDTIEISRRVLQILERLHIEWATKLDAKLAELEDRILEPIREIRRYLNEALNWINRIVTLDGLLQRVMLLRSIARDARDVTRLIVNWRSRPVTPAQRDGLRQLAGTRSFADVERDLTDYVQTGGGNYGPYASELAAMWAISMRGG